MKSSYVVFLLIIITALKLYAGTYSGGDGSSGNPYQIANTDDLIELSNTSADWAAGVYFIQTGNITFNSDETLVDWDGDGTADWDAQDQLGFSPIGNNTTEFMGEYDGDGYTIANLYINRPIRNFIGLFGRAKGATIENLGIENCDIIGRHYVGGLAGYNYQSDISNSYSTGNVSSTNDVVGGLVGTNDQSDISDSYSICDVSGNIYVGGLVGANGQSDISNSYSTGDVSGNVYVGGLVGYNINSSQISNSYSIGDVTRSSGTNVSFGGFCGRNENSTIEYCYSIGSVDCGGATNKGFVGGESGSTNYTDNFFDSEASNQNNDAVGAATPKTTSQMNDLSTFTGASWNFDNIWIMGENLNNGYPALWVGFENTYEPTDIDSPSDGVINIRNIAELRWISENSSSWSSDFELDNDIDASSTLYWNVGDHDANAGTPDEPMGFSPIGTLALFFTGDFDGNSYIIDNLYINRQNIDFVGLFGYSKDNDVYDLGLENVDISGINSTGGIFGYGNTVNINRLYSTGNVNGYNVVGGLSGQIIGNINNCYSECNVTGNNNIGGLFGANAGSINNTYAIGDVNGADYIGGLIGDNISGDINNSYSTGQVSGHFTGGLVASNSATVTNSFWDTESSGITWGAGGTGKTTAEMKDFRTFTDQSTSGLTTAWDFVSNPNDDAANNDYWDMDQDWSVNNGYPILSYQTESDNILAFNGGLGTSGSPFQIDNLTNLMILSLSPQYWDSDYIQTSDIDATATQYWDDADDDSDGHPYNDANDATSTGNNEGFSPIGNITTKFTGEYDGDGYEVSNLFIDRSGTDYIGLFGYLDGGMISNFGLLNVDIAGDQYVGGLLGYCRNSSTVSNSYSTGDIDGVNRVGGLVGYNNTGSHVSNSYSTGDVSGSGYDVGGLVGYNSSFSTVSNSYSMGDVSADYTVGGLVGWNYQGIVSNSYSMGDVEGMNRVGGLVGDNYYFSTITNSYSTGNVIRSIGSNNYLGGISGYNDDSIIEYCYSTGSVIYTGNPDPTDKGFVGGESGTNTYTDNFFDSETSNQNTDAVGSATPKTTEEMKSAPTFLNAGWDFLDETDNGTDDYWGINSTDNNGYPWLEWQGYTNDLGVLPVLSTNTIQIIGDSKANSGGGITNEGASSITAKGLCWNTTGSPTLSDNYTVDGTGDSGYTSLMTGLQVNTQYYVRAYATNSYGTGYGDEKTFIYTAIPTLPQWGLIIFGGLIAVFAVRKMLV